MNNLINRLLFLLSLLLIVSMSSAADKVGFLCVTDVIGKINLVRIDNEQKRFFIIRNKIDIAEIKSLIKKMEKCLASDEWSGHWLLSVFSEKKLAGYKDEPHIIPFHDNDEWAKGYLAEYNSTSGILTLFPLTRPETFTLNGHDQ